MAGALGPQPILWAAEFYDATGYSEEARTFVAATDRAGRPIAAQEWPTRNERVELARECRHALDVALKRQPPRPFVNVWHKQPATTLRATPWGLGPTVIRSMFETDSIPREWPAAFARVDAVWVPSRFNRRTFASAGVPEDKLRVLPEPIDLTLFDRARTAPLQRPAAARTFCFLSVANLSSRKGWDVLLRAWSRAFDRNDDTCLVLKLSDARPDAAAWKAFTAALAPSHAPVICIRRKLPQRDVPRLYATCDAYVGPSRGEGWGRPFMEAMAMGLPTIGPRWGGNLDFMDDENALLVDGQLVPVPADEAFEAFRGMRWFEPDVEHLADLLREVYAGGPGVRDRARRARVDLSERFSEEVIARKLSKLAEEELRRWRR